MGPSLRICDRLRHSSTQSLRQSAESLEQTGCTWSKISRAADGACARTLIPPSVQSGVKLGAWGLRVFPSLPGRLQRSRKQLVSWHWRGTRIEGRNAKDAQGQLIIGLPPSTVVANARLIRAVLLKVLPHTLSIGGGQHHRTFFLLDCCGDGGSATT